MFPLVYTSKEAVNLPPTVSIYQSLSGSPWDDIIKSLFDPVATVIPEPPDIIKVLDPS